MKGTLPKTRRRVSDANSVDLSNFDQLRIPKDFVFKLLEKMVSDLAEQPTKSGDCPILMHPDIDLSQVKKAIRARDLKAVLQATRLLDARSITSRWSTMPEKAFGLYQIHTLLKKFPISGIACEMAAYNSFRGYEKHCKLFNDENYKAILRLDHSHPDYLGIIEEIRTEIRRCIGARPPVQSILANAKHGPGSTVDSMPGQVTAYFKFAALPYTVSSSALPLAREAIASDPRWIGALMDRYRNMKLDGDQVSPVDMEDFWNFVLKVCDYSRYATVPKSADTNRSIEIGPALNVFLQLGVDGVIRHRLKARMGIDINTQLVNQLLAQSASVTNEDATIDLKGASDCVSYMAALLLLPEEWFALLDDLRTKKILVPKKYTDTEDEVISIEKFSAMGNGFTFVIETLLFACIAKVAMRRNGISGNLAVYGDDIIVPKTAAAKVIELLGYFGFDTNVDKTFVEGPFRESCGVDCLNGINIRPLFLKKPVIDVSDLWYISNSLYVLERRLPEFWEISFQTTREWIYSYIPAEYRHIVGPPSQSLDTYLFKSKVRFDENGLHKHLAVVPVPKIFNRQAQDFFFRKLMVSLKPTSSSTDSLARLDHFHYSKIFGGVIDLQSGWKTGGAVRDKQKVSTSAFDVTLRGCTTLRVTTRQAWRN